MPWVNYWNRWWIYASSLYFSVYFCLASKFSIIIRFYIIISKLDHLYCLLVHFNCFYDIALFCLLLIHLWSSLLEKLALFPLVSEFCLWLFCGIAFHFKVVKFINISFYKRMSYLKRHPSLSRVHNIHPRFL